jgi:alanine dehydrogenase
MVHGVVHYCVANMPGAVPRTSTFALNNATISYGVRIADLGIVKAAEDRAILGGVNTHAGRCTHRAVAHAVGAEYVPFAAAKN